MALNEVAYKWQKSVQREGDFPAVKSEPCLSDERFAPLDWRDYIEISADYTESERQTLVQMLDDVTNNIAEVRYLLRRTKDPVTRFRFNSGLGNDDSARLNPEVKLRIAPSDAEGFGSVAFGALQGRNTIMITLDDEYITGQLIADKDKNPYKPTLSEIFIHELLHFSSASIPFEYLSREILGSAMEEVDQQILSHQESMASGDSDKVEASSLAELAMTKEILSAKRQKIREFSVEIMQYCERLTVPQTNITGKRYFGTIPRNADYHARANIVKDRMLGRDFKEELALYKESHLQRISNQTQMSNGIPMLYVDAEGHRWRPIIENLVEMKKNAPEDFKDVEATFVESIKRAQRDALGL